MKQTLVLEGGGMRGVFTAGVLDCLLDEKIYFPRVIGVSAGSSNGLSYASRQRGRARFCNIDALANRKYIGLKYLFTNRCIMDYDYLFAELPRRVYPYDFDAYLKSGDFELVATNCRTGKPDYLEKPKTFAATLAACRASCSLPYVCPLTRIRGVPYLDGGISDAIPVRHALETGAGKILLVLTRNRGFRKPPMYLSIAKILYKRYPRLIDALKRAHEAYNESLAYADKLEREGRIVALRPARPLQVGRLERDPEKLADLYDEGYRLCGAALSKIRAMF